MKYQLLHENKIFPHMKGLLLLWLHNKLLLLQPSEMLRYFIGACMIKFIIIMNITWPLTDTFFFFFDEKHTLFIAAVIN